MNKKIQDIDAKTEARILHQILEEHVEKSKKHYNPCQDCIRLGINKGSQLQKADFRKMIENFKGEEYTDLEIWEDIKKQLLKETKNA